MNPRVEYMKFCNISRRHKRRIHRERHDPRPGASGGVRAAGQMLRERGQSMLARGGAVNA